MRLGLCGGVGVWVWGRGRWGVGRGFCWECGMRKLGSLFGWGLGVGFKEKDLGGVEGKGLERGLEGCG